MEINFEIIYIFTHYLSIDDAEVILDFENIRIPEVIWYKSLSLFKLRPCCGTDSRIHLF